MSNVNIPEDKLVPVEIYFKCKEHTGFQTLNGKRGLKYQQVLID